MIDVVDKDFAIIVSQQLPSKLFIAGGGNYDKVWIRDNVYVALAFAEAGRYTEAAEVYAGLCGIIEKYEPILNRTQYPTQDSELLHPRFTVVGEEVLGHWSNKQHDAVGVLLYGLGQLHVTGEQPVTETEQRIAQKLVHYLEVCRYWEDKDNGMWEEAPALHASSLAACIRGIEMVGSFCHHDKVGLEKAKMALAQLLPNESTDHPVDMALLSLIWPYGYKRRDLVERVETGLLRRQGVIRHVGDKYEAGGHEEAQWVMGIPWLGIAHFELGDIQKAQSYLDATEQLYTRNGLPESYLAHNKVSVHTPLAWSHALVIVLRSKLALAHAQGRS
jgi:GH15 family glucan-1,4-alpha-glucosidase